jgi:membrane-bound lytic murein transglycosylase D
VAGVAKRYRVSAAQVAQWNDVGADARFRPGQTIVVVQPVAAKKSSRTSAAVTAQRPAAAKAPAKRTAAAKPAAKPTAKVAASRGSSKL